MLELNAFSFNLRTFTSEFGWMVFLCAPPPPLRDFGCYSFILSFLLQKVYSWFQGWRLHLGSTTVNSQYEVQSASEVSHRWAEKYQNEPIRETAKTWGGADANIWYRNTNRPTRISWIKRSCISVGLSWLNKKYKEKYKENTWTDETKKKKSLGSCSWSEARHFIL